MPIYRDKEAGCWRFEFNRVIPGAGRVRARKRLPKSWSQAQADAFDRAESARLYAIATGVERPTHTIEDAVAVYLTERAPAMKSGKRVAQDLALVWWAYKGQPLDKLPEVCTKIRERSVGLSPATIRNRIRYLTSAARYAWKHHGMCEHDPAARVIVPKVDNERQVYAERDDVLRVMRALGRLRYQPRQRIRSDALPLAQKVRDTRDLVRVLYYSGMRVSEALRARVTEAGFELDDTKNGRPRIVPIHARAAAASRRWPPASPRSEMEKLWRLARDAAGLPDLWMHSLRHSTATAMVNAGVDLTTVGAVLGHKSYQSTRRYSHFATNTLAGAVSKIGKKRAA